MSIKLKNFSKCLFFLILNAFVIRASSSCVDSNIHCESWKQKGECTKNPAYMLKSCKKSCGQCGSTGCTDNNAYCADWASKGECSRNPGYMLKDCKKSCNQCGTPNPNPPNPQPPKGCPVYRSPPYSGTIFNFPNIVKATDPTSYTGIRYLRQEITNNPQMFDGRCSVNGFRSYNAYVFSASYSDHSNVLFRCNPEFGYSEAQRVASHYANALGRIPLIFRSRVDFFDLNRGGDSCSRGGGNWDLRSLSLNTDYAVVQENKGILEELFIHEAAHASLDGAHSNANGWRVARNSDRNRYISTYAQTNPNREDVAESVLLWLAVRHRASRIPANDQKTIKCTIPNRLAYFDRTIAIRFPK